MPSGPKSALTNHLQVCVETNKPLMATGQKRKGHLHAEQVIYRKKRKDKERKLVAMVELSFFEFLQKIEKVSAQVGLLCPPQKATPKPHFLAVFGLCQDVLSASSSSSWHTWLFWMEPAIQSLFPWQAVPIGVSRLEMPTGM